MQAIFVVSSVLLWVVVLLNLVLTLALVRRASAPDRQRVGPTPGTRAPNFRAETLSGETVDLVDYDGKAVTLLFIGAHCGPCRDFLPHYQALEPFARQAGVELVLVSVEDAATTRAFVEEHKITLPVLVAPRERNPFTADYNISGTPIYCLLNADGTVQSAGYASLKVGGWPKLADAWKRSLPRGAGQARAWI